MKRSILFITMVSLTGSLLAAPKDDVQGAIKKLADTGNYSWKTTSQNAGGAGGGGRRGFGGGPQEGKISQDGFATVSITGGQNTTEAVIKGDKVAVKRDDGWQTLEELVANAQQGGGGRGRGGAGALRNFKTPAADAETLLGSVKELASADGAYSADLPEDAVKQRLTFGGRRNGGDGPTISEAKGSVKFWIKDGVLSKYKLKVQGKINFNGNDRDIDRTTTVEIKDVGTTKVEVPEDAKKKLS